MQCPNCQCENRVGAKFCNECAAPLPLRCPACGTENRPGAKFCNECAASLTEAGGRYPQATGSKPAQQPAKGERRGRAQRLRSMSQQPSPRLSERGGAAAERRQLTVLFCDLVGSTQLSVQLDPEEWRVVVQEYQRLCAEVVRRFDGHIAQYLGDGLLVYFGYPAAHEDDARRATRAGLGILAALDDLNARRAQPIRVRMGIHTGLVVVGEIGEGGKHEPLALGDTPNLAARLQGLAEPDTLVISATTQRLILGFFDCQDLGPQALKGVSAPLQVYRVLSESSAQSRLEVDVSTGKLTPLVGRAHEVGLILERWAAAQAGEGQVVLLSGEPGIGKSRLVQEVKERVVQARATCLEFRCSPYTQNSAFAPVLTQLQRLLHFQQDDTPQTKLEKLAQTLARYRFPQADTLPLWAALLSLPQPAQIPPLNLSPQRQKQKTHEALAAWLVEEATHAPVYCAWEDLHWADPSTLEFLGLLLDQVPTTCLLVLLTTRPEFTPPWSSRIHLTPLTLARLPRTQAAELIEKVTGGKPLPAPVHQQIIQKTDGVPLFMEELTKMVLESGLVREVNGRYELTGPLPPLAIPTTLQDSLMARLDRLATVKEVAQLGATLGREFSYEVLQAVALQEGSTLQQALAKLVEAEVLYQRGQPPQARYVFKHALIQDAAYQSLLKSRRQQYHQQIARVLEGRFAEITETQPELLAHHYTEAGLIGQALPYWQRAGQRAVTRSANVEAISHLTKALELLKTLPDTPERTQQELTLQTALGVPLTATRSWAAPEVGAAYARALELCRQLDETSQLFRVLQGLWTFYIVRAECETARELGEQCLSLAQSAQDPVLLLEAHLALGSACYSLGEFAQARAHMEEGIAFYDPQQHRSLAFLYGSFDPGVACRSFAAQVLWLLGYPDQALKRSHEALTLAQELSHPFSLAWVLSFAAWFHQLRRDERAVQARAEAVIALATEQGFPFWAAFGDALRGWALAEQGQGEEGIAQLHQGLAAWQATGTEWDRPYFLALLAEAYGKVRQATEGLTVLAEALATVHKNGERRWETELYRLQGELLLAQVGYELQAITHRERMKEAEECYWKAIQIARQRQAKSLELRAVMSLARLRQQQGKKDEARQMLAEIYGWFTEGFDTKDLQEAKALLEELS
jgi:class 3 adenylate cyclase/predicted ATPase